MPVADRMTFLASPVNTRDQVARIVIKQIAQVVCDLKGGHMLEIQGLDVELIRSKPRVMDAKFLFSLEALHRAIGLYLWFSYRYPNLFVSQALAFHFKAQLEERINDVLSQMRYDVTQRQAYRAMVRDRLLRKRQQEESFLGSEEGELEDGKRHEVPGVWGEEGHEPLVESQAELMIEGDLDMRHKRRHLEQPGRAPPPPPPPPSGSGTQDVAW